jgi:methylamine--corrinoid protein Co-methyltransferase
VGSADGALPNGTGLEARWMGEVGHAVADQGLTLKEVNQLISSIYAKYAHVFKTPGGNPGVRFDQAYDIETIQPVPQWLQMYENVKKDIAGLGFSVK